MSILSDYRVGKYENPITFAVKHKDFDVRMESRSGGFFTALSDKVLANGGVVYGCIIDKNFLAIHTRTENKSERNKMRGSKYIQSDIRDVYKEVKSDLDNSREVLFSGTSCQVAGLKGYLGKNFDNLLCVDIVCHGVPSPRVWKDYLVWQEKKNKVKISAVEFRNKKVYGWKAHIESLYLENGKRIDSRVFTTMFYGHAILRPCCYKCPYKDVIHPGDITIGDYWGIDKAAPGFNDNYGVSLILVNDNKGRQKFDDTYNMLEIYNTKIEDSIQTPLIKPFESPENRDEFWNDYRTHKFIYIAKKYGDYGYIAKFKRRLKHFINCSKWKRE